MESVPKGQNIYEPIKPLFENQFSSEIVRLVSFLNWDTSSYGPLQSLLASAGFYYTGKEDLVECFACGLKLRSTDFSKDPLKEHETASPTCLFKKLNQPLTDTSVEHQDSIEALELETKKMQCDTENLQSNNNPIKIEELRSLPPMKKNVPNNHTFGRLNSNSGDTTDMFSIADPKERGPHPNIDLLRNESCRIQTFRVWPSNAPVTSAELARAGFFFVGPNDRVQCTFCRGILKNWAPGDSAVDEHKKHFPFCGFMNGLNVGNVPLPTPAVSGYPASMSINQVNKLDVTSNYADMYDETGIVVDSPKHPEYAMLAARLNTFKNWPSNVAQSPERLANCGFYSLGIDDSVKCFYCDGGLRSWEQGDDPWVEHARWFKTCGYLRQAKGLTFIQEINNRFPASAPDMEPVEPMVTSSPENDTVISLPGDNESAEDAEISKQMQRQDLQEVFSMGFEREVVRRAIRSQYRYNGKPFTNLSELTDAILNIDESSSSGSDEDESNPKKDVSNTLHMGKTEAPSSSAAETQQAATNQPLSAPPLEAGKSEKKKRKKKAEEKSLQEEIRVLKEERVCKVCLDEVISIVFLPCGHMVCCSTCAPALRVCPICRENIKGNVKAYIA